MRKLRVEGGDLTIQEYVILRQIKWVGDWRVDKLTEIKRFDPKAYRSLVRKGALIERPLLRKVHCHPDIDMVITRVRNLLGVNEL